MTDAVTKESTLIAENIVRDWRGRNLDEEDVDLVLHIARGIDAEIARDKAGQQRKMLTERLANRQSPLVIAEDYGIPILDESDPAREKETS